MGVPIVYFRSSSFNDHRFCPMKFYINYSLGWPGTSGKAADKGTIVHKVLEIAALCKKASQDGKKTIDDPILGQIDTDNYDPEYLSDIVSRIFEYYTSQIPHHKWGRADLKHCKTWVSEVFSFNDGMFDPKNRNIVAAEPFFDIEIDKPWADYEYNVNGKVISGKLSIKGTIDLVTSPADGILEVIDWKTGKYRKDWATDKEYTTKRLRKNCQLRFYHYALKHMHPNIDCFMVTIYYIQAGGPFTVVFTDNDIEKTEEIIRTRFEFIKNTKCPSLITQKNPRESWKCRTLCHYGKNSFEGTDVPVITRGRKPMTICQQTKYLIDKNGIDWANDNLQHPDHEVGKYKNPGSIE